MNGQPKTNVREDELEVGETKKNPSGFCLKGPGARVFRQLRV